MSQTKREPFTAYPNKYTDKIKPHLTGVQRDVCDLIIRKTRGWHRRSASIPNSEFIRKTRRSARAIITAKKELAAMGLLVVERPGGGSATGEYRLDIHYDSKNGENGETGKLAESAEFMENRAPAENHKFCKKSHGVQECQDTIQPGPVDVNGGEIPHHESQDTEVVASEAPATAEVPESSSDEVSESQTGELNAPVAIPDPSSILINNKKQTEADTDKAERKKAAAAVCYLLKKYGFRIQSENYGFIGWCIKQYGADTVNHKLSILKYQRIRGVQVHNVYAWLRNALTCDYDYSGFDMARVKAEAKAQKLREYSQAWYDAQEKQRAQVQAERGDPEAQARVAAAQAAFWRTVGGPA